ncbi:MAG: caspase family protein [Planctomycetes bacterium]|nr:caspase family protein [Planctomycetota bacterium]
MLECENMNQFALIIGIEYYSEKIPPVLYAENDATAFRECLIELGYDPRDVTCLKSVQATKTKIESEIRRIANLSQEADDVLLFFAGHGVSINESNYMMCHDTVRTDLINSCIQLKWILDLLKTSRSKRKVLFLDSCHSGLEMDEAMRGIFETFDEAELDAFFASSEYEIGFASCRADESSYSSPNLRHGIWTYHLLEALKGRAPLAVEKDKHITGTSLQNFLADQVPKTLRIENPDPVAQTPKCFGSFSKAFSLFDVEGILARRKAERKARLIGVKRIDMLGSKGGSIRELSGFRKTHHRIPDAINDRTEMFVQGIASDDVRIEATQLHNSLKANYGYKRKEIQLDIQGASADIATKDFDLSIAFSQNTEDAGDYTIEYLITNVRDPDALQDEGLQKILHQHFDEVRFSIKGRVDLGEIIDAIEAETQDQISIDYPPDCSHLKIIPAACRWSINMSTSHISIVNDYLESPASMLDRLKESQGFISGDSILHPLLY